MSAATGWLVAAGVLWLLLLVAAAVEQVRYDLRPPALGPLCHCGCGRPVGQHNPMRSRLTNLIGRHL